MKPLSRSLLALAFVIVAAVPTYATNCETYAIDASATTDLVTNYALVQVSGAAMLTDESGYTCRD